jgi:hypothetical protein
MRAVALRTTSHVHIGARKVDLAVSPGVAHAVAFTEVRARVRARVRVCLCAYIVACLCARARLCALMRCAHVMIFCVMLCEVI